LKGQGPKRRCEVRGLVITQKNQNSQAAEKMARYKEAKKSRTRGSAQICGLVFSLKQQIAILGRPAQHV
jgi:hypothetical protein